MSDATQVDTVVSEYNNFLCFCVIYEVQITEVLQQKEKVLRNELNLNLTEQYLLKNVSI